MEKNVGSVDIEELKRAREELNQERGIETDPNMYSNYNPNRAKEEASASDAENPQPEPSASEEQSFSESSNDYSNASETENFETSSNEPDEYAGSEEVAEDSDQTSPENPAEYGSAEQNFEPETSVEPETQQADAASADEQGEEGIDIDLSDDDMSLDDILDKLMENSEKQQSTAAANGGFGVLSDGSEPAGTENSFATTGFSGQSSAVESAPLATENAQSENNEPEQKSEAIIGADQMENTETSSSEISSTEEVSSDNFASNNSGEKDFSVYDNFSEFEVKGYAPVSESNSTDEFKNLIDEVIGSGDPVTVLEPETISEETERSESDDLVEKSETSDAAETAMQSEAVTTETNSQETAETETSNAETTDESSENEHIEQAETESQEITNEQAIESVQAENSEVESEVSEAGEAEETASDAEETASEAETETTEIENTFAEQEAISEPEQNNIVGVQAAPEKVNKQAESSEEKLKIIKDYKFSSALKDAEFKESDDFSFLLGKGENNKLMFTALCDMNNIGVFGANRAEAFSLMGTIICSLQTKLGINEFNYVICDSSIDSEFDVFDSSSYMFFSRVAKTNREILDILVELENELDSRYGTLVEAKARSIEHYNEYAKSQEIEPMPYIVLLFNNYSRAASLKLGEQINESLSNILRLGRLVGIYAIVSAGEEIENKSINLNLASRICYKCDSEEMSNFAVGSDDAVKLSEEQEFIYSSVENDDLYHLKSPIFSKSDATTTIKNTEK